jgi:sigma-B regulation protein RsbU (phosphoserine phosphatase)
MSDSQKTKRLGIELKHYIWAVLIVWMGVTASSLVWNVSQEKRSATALELALLQARENGISVSVPTELLRAVSKKHILSLSLWHSLILLVGLSIIIIAGKRLSASDNAIEIKREELQKAYALLDRELKTVADVQLGLLPAQMPQIQGFEVVTHYQPARRAGGDYFDFFALPGKRWGVLVADVSGHGAPAAVLMAMTRVMLHTSGTLMPPEQALEDLNKNLCKNIFSSHFVTCWYGVLDPGTQTFTFASAAHPEPVIFEPELGRVYGCNTEGGMPLGLDATAQYTASSITLKNGSVLVLYTDGISEAFNNAGQEFGLARLMDVVESHGVDSPAHLCEEILAAVDVHRGSVEINDDTTLVILRSCATY